MPVYIRIDDIKGDVQPAGGATGGVWKTANFLTGDPAANGPLGRPKIKVFICPSDPGVVQLSRISLFQNGGGVDGHDPAARFKIEQLINTVRSQGPSGKLYVATNAGVYAGASNNRGQLLVGIDKVTLTSTYDAPQGRLLAGSDQGVWRSAGAHNLKQISVGVHNTVEIVVTDPSGLVVGSHRLPNVSVTGTSGTFTLTFNGQTTGG